MQSGLGAGADHIGGRGNRTQDADPVDLARGLGARDVRHREGAEGEAADEGAPVHQSITSSQRRRSTTRR
jgi:hypothetical protein